MAAGGGFQVTGKLALPTSLSVTLTQGTRNGDRGKTSRAMEADLGLEGSDGAVEKVDLGGEEEEDLS